jgi:hypothetical protein
VEDTKGVHKAVSCNNVMQFGRIPLPEVEVTIHILARNDTIKVTHHDRILTQKQRADPTAQHVGERPPGRSVCRHMKV